MHAPKAPTPDPAVAAAQAAEQKRAEAGQVSQTQAGLRADTSALRRRFGVMASSMATPAAAFNGVAPGLPAPSISSSPYAPAFNLASLSGLQF